MEFVIVTCGDIPRTVFVDNQFQGSTGRRLSMPEGLHVFDLGAPVDYEPPFQEFFVSGTTHTRPMPIAFTALVARDVVPTRRKRTRKTARKTTDGRRPTPTKAAAKRPARRTARKTTDGRRPTPTKARKAASTKRSARATSRKSPVRKSATRKSAKRKSAAKSRKR